MAKKYKYKRSEIFQIFNDILVKIIWKLKHMRSNLVIDAMFLFAFYFLDL